MAVSETGAFFRYCPACGKRFHIRLEGKKLIKDEREEKVRKVQSSYDGFYGTPLQWANPTVLWTEVPITVEAEDFEYLYRCGHCGHVWTEMRHQEKDVR